MHLIGLSFIPLRSECVANVFFFFLLVFCSQCVFFDSCDTGGQRQEGPVEAVSEGGAWESRTERTECESLTQTHTHTFENLENAKSSGFMKSLKTN